MGQVTWEDVMPMVHEPSWIYQINDNPLFVEHVGFSSYFPGQDKSIRPREYTEYKTNVVAKIRAAATTRSVIVMTPRDYLAQTIDMIGFIAPSMIFLPTKGNHPYICDENQLQIQRPAAEQLCACIGSNITKAEIIGEYGDPSRCVRVLSGILDRTGVSISFDESCIYYSCEAAPWDGIV